MKKKDDNNVTGYSNRKAVIESLISGSTSSAFTTIILQPLELLKTRIQLESREQSSPHRVLGRTTRSANILISEHGISYLWRGTGAVSIATVKLLHIDMDQLFLTD